MGRGFLMRHRRQIGHLAMRDRSNPPGDMLAGCVVLVFAGGGFLCAFGAIAAVVGALLGLVSGDWLYVRESALFLGKSLIALGCIAGVVFAWIGVEKWSRGGQLGVRRRRLVRAYWIVFTLIFVATLTMFGLVSRGIIHP